MRNPADKKTTPAAVPEDSTPKESTTEHQAKSAPQRSADEVKVHRPKEATTKKKGPAKVTPPAAPSAAPPGDFSELLATFEGHDLKAEEVGLELIQKWHRTAEENRWASFARGYLIGRALQARKANVQQGWVEHWARHEVGLTPQMVNIYIRGYEGIQKDIDSENRFSLPKDMGFTAWVANQRQAAQGDDAATKKNPTGKWNPKVAAKALAKHGGKVLEKEGVEVEGIDSQSRDNLRERAKKAADDLIKALNPAVTGVLQDLDLSQVTERMSVLMAALLALDTPVSALSKERKKLHLPEDMSEFDDTFMSGSVTTPDLERMTVNAHVLFDGEKALKAAIPKTGRRESPARRYLLDIRSIEDEGLFRILTSSKGVTGRVSLKGEGNPAIATVSVERDELHEALRSVIGQEVHLAATKEYLHLLDQKWDNGIPALSFSDAQQRLLGETFAGEEIGIFNTKALAGTFHHLMQSIKDGIMWMDDGYLATRNQDWVAHGREWSVLRMDRGLQLGSLNGKLDWAAARSLFQFFKAMKHKQVTLATNETQLIVQVPDCVDLAVPVMHRAGENPGIADPNKAQENAWWTVDSKELSGAAKGAVCGAQEGDDNLHISQGSLGEMVISMDSYVEGGANFQRLPSGRYVSSINTSQQPVAPITVSQQGLLTAARGKKRELRLGLVHEEEGPGYVRITEGDRLTVLSILPSRRC